MNNFLDYIVKYIKQVDLFFYKNIVYKVETTVDNISDSDSSNIISTEIDIITAEVVKNYYDYDIPTDQLHIL